MKLRCTKNSIRIRVRKSDLLLLKKQNNIVEQLDFGINSFSFSIATNHDLKQITAVYNQDQIQIEIPMVVATNWIESQLVGLEHTHNNIHILLEKDFPCKDREEEDKQDTFWELATNDDAC